MKARDRRQWRAAKTVADIGELTARWLEGRLVSLTGNMANCGPDDETTDLIPVLAALNRHGYVTYSSQPGFDPALDFGDVIWSKRAGVSGFAAPDLARDIATAATAAGLLVVHNAGVGDDEADDGLAVTTRDGEDCTWFGRHLTRGNLADLYPDCTDVVRQAMASAVQLTLVDPEPRREDILWPFLADFLTSTTRSRTPRRLRASAFPAGWRWLSQRLDIACRTVHGHANAYGQAAAIRAGHADRVEQAHAYRLPPAGTSHV